jgi:hypothetical protein
MDKDVEEIILFSMSLDVLEYRKIQSSSALLNDVLWDKNVNKFRLQIILRFRVTS